MRYLAVLCLLICTLVASAQGDRFLWSVKATDYQRSDLAWHNKEDQREKDRQEGFLRGAQGWVEYDMLVPRDAWYELWVNGEMGWITEIRLDGTILGFGTFREQQGEKKLGFKIQNVWLDAGKTHVIHMRMQQWPGFWNTGVSVREGDRTPATLACAKRTTSEIQRSGDTLKFNITGGGLDTPAHYTVLMRRPGDPAPASQAQVDFPAAPRPVTREISFPCRQEGYFEIIAQANGADLGRGDLRLGYAVVVDTKGAANLPATMKETLVVDIDCTQDLKTGFWEKDGQTRVVTAPFGKYRESSGKGPEPYWATDGFSYACALPEANVPYRLKVTYPDDDRRTMGFWVNDQVKLNHDVGAVMTGGVETGDHYRLTNTMQTHEAIFYPRNNKDLRVAVVNLNHGMRAAAARIQIYKIDGPLSAGPVGRPDGRRMGFYFEEPSRWLRQFGAHDTTLGQHLITLERWAAMSRYTGANLLYPTINVYQGNAYPSQVLDGFFCSPVDQPRLTALIAEKYGLKYIPEFHVVGQGWFDTRVMKQGTPEGDEYLIRDKDGKPGVYNALHPFVQQKYTDILGECADRLAGCPAYAGISSRLMLGWQWRGWNVLPGIQWGYDDWTIGQFEQDTRIRVPGVADDPQRFRRRYEFLTGPQRKAWEEWRCAKILAYHRRLRDRIRKTNPQAVLYFTSPDLPKAVGRTWQDKFREVGVDMDAYAKEPGLMIFPCVMYGRRGSTPVSDAVGFDSILNPDVSAIGTLGERGYMLWSTYFEVNANIDWKALGADMPGISFDACAPSGRHELELYALALAETDATHLANGGNGNIFGTPTYMREFLAEYLALPALPFTTLASGRDPVAVRYRQCDDGCYAYAVNRERYAVRTTLTIKGGGAVTAAPTGAAVQAPGGVLTFTLAPYQLRTFKIAGKPTITQCVTEVPEAVASALAGQLAEVDKIAAGIKDRSLAFEITQEEADAVGALIAEAQTAFREGRYWRARVNLERPELVRVYDRIGRWPAGVQSRKQPHGLVKESPVATPRLEFAGVAAMTGDVRGRLASVKDLCYDPQGNLWVASPDQVMVFSPNRKYLRAVTLTQPQKPDEGDRRWGGLKSPLYQVADGIRVLPDGRLLSLGYNTGLFAHQPTTGRVLPLAAGARFPLPEGQYWHFTTDTKGDLYVACQGKTDTGVWKFHPDGTAAFDFGEVPKSNRLCTINPAGLAVDAAGAIFVSDRAGNAVRWYSPAGKELGSLPVTADDGPRRIAVTPDGAWLFVATGRGAFLIGAQRQADGTYAQQWKAACGQNVTALAFSATRELAVGLAGDAEGAVVRSATYDAGGLQWKDPLVPSLDPQYPAFLESYTRLKAFGNALYYLNRGKLIRLTPGDPDRADVVYDPGRITELLSFAFAPNGDLYLGSNGWPWKREVIIYQCKKTENGWEKPVSITGETPFHPVGISMIPFDLAVDGDGRVLARWDPKNDWTYLRLYTREAAGEMKLLADLGVMSGIHGPWTGHFGVHVDADGRVYIAGGGARNVTCLAKDGTRLWQAAYAAEQAPGQLPIRGPNALTTDSRGYLWVADTDANRLILFDNNGKLVDTYGAFGTLDRTDGLSFNAPGGIATVRDALGQEWLYIADSRNQRIMKYRIK